MAFNSIPDILIQVGKAVKRDIFTLVKDNDDDLNSRLNTLESNANSNLIYSGLITNAVSANSFSGLMIHRVETSINLIDCKIAIFTKGSLTGILEVDIQRSSSPDFTSSVSVFTTRPSIDYSTAIDYAESSNAVFDNGQIALSEGDYLRLDVTSLPTSGVISKFVFYLNGEPQ